MPFDIIKHSNSDTSAPVVLIIDDEFTSRAIFEQIVHSIRDGIIVQSFASPVEALRYMRTSPPDLILLDYLMEEMSGLEVLKKIRQLRLLEDIPVIIVTVATDEHIRYQALECGATDFITKPLDVYECRARCRNLLSLSLHHKAQHQRAQSLEKAITEATQQILEREYETLFRLAKAGEYRDTETGNHVLRMAKYSRLIAQGLGLDEEHCHLIEMAAPMHDIGKIGIPDHILLKPGKLTADEFAIMQKHPAIGFEILQDSSSKFIRLGAIIALSHHEKFDGSGYPQGLKGKDIPLEARIVAIADVFDALTSIRPYKKAWTNEDALAFLIANQGGHFDPRCLAVFVEQFSKVVLIQQQLRDFHYTQLNEVKP
jgi:two-component system response regulator RpfG